MYSLISQDRETQDLYEIYVAVTNYKQDPATVSSAC